MTTTAPGAPAPEHLESRFATCVATGDLDGIMSLYAADAVVSLPRGREAAGTTAIRAAFATALDSGAFDGCGLGAGVGRSAGTDDVAVATARAIVSGDLAMTTATGADGIVRTQVARRQGDDTWVWVRDGSRLRDVAACLPATGMPAAVA